MHITLHVCAGMALGKDAPKNIQHLIAKYGDQSSFIRELTFRSLDPKNLTLAYRNILEVLPTPMWM